MIQDVSMTILNRFIQFLINFKNQGFLVWRLRVHGHGGSFFISLIYYIFQGILNTFIDLLKELWFDLYRIIHLRFVTPPIIIFI